jgi:hypothetical protein
VILGVYLSKVKVYEGVGEEQAVKENAMFAFLVNVSHKRRLFEVFLMLSDHSGILLGIRPVPLSLSIRRTGSFFSRHCRF